MKSRAASKGSRDVEVVRSFSKMRREGLGGYPAFAPVSASVGQLVDNVGQFPVETDWDNMAVFVPWDEMTGRLNVFTSPNPMNTWVTTDSALIFPGDMPLPADPYVADTMRFSPADTGSYLISVSALMRAYYDLSVGPGHTFGINWSLIVAPRLHLKDITDIGAMSEDNRIDLASHYNLSDSGTPLELSSAIMMKVNRYEEVTLCVWFEGEDASTPGQLNIEMLYNAGDSVRPPIFQVARVG